MSRKGVFLTSAVVAFLALFSTLDLFSDQRKLLLRLVPLRLKLYFSGGGPVYAEDTSTLHPYDVIVDESNVLLMTKDELALYDGSEGSPGLYLAILGRVYDVSKGKDHYAAGKGYSFFTARDGTRAFVTGDFTERGLKDNVDGFKGEQMLEIENWIKFYDKTYTFKGKLVGNFYNAEGQATQALHDAQAAINDAIVQKQLTLNDKKMFPPCNSQTKQNSGTRVWCTQQSGGIKRAVAGVPRKYYRPGHSTPRCACIRTTGPPSDDPSSQSNRGDLDNPLFKEYEGCEPLSESCYLQIAP